MKRDLDLIRDLLLDIESNAEFGKSLFNYKPNLKSHYSDEDINGHLLLLIDEEYIVAMVERYVGNEVPLFDIERLTSLGHDYLDSVRDPKIWNNTKASIAKVGGATTLAVVQAVAVANIKTILGLP